MKSYKENISEISADELFDGLIGYGLFAEKIPNFITSEAFLAYTKTIVLPTNDKPKDYIRYSSMRNINIPRPMAIPHPFSYANKCKSLKDNWLVLQQYFDDKTQNDNHKISRIHLRKLKDKSHLFEMSYKNYEDDGNPIDDIIIKSKYIACADISTCFPSIYSHSIAWALVGKSHAKENSKPSDKNLWFNQIDFYSRSVKFGETNGLLIGPHSSNLISEIILVAVDHKLSTKNYNYIRNIDDYTCYVESFEKAEQFFIDLSEELKKYELVLNNKKSKIIPLPQASIKNWVTKLNHFNFTNKFFHNGKIGIKIKELKSYLDFSIELMLKEDSDASIINYAIKTLSNKYLGTNAKEYYIKQIHHLVLLYPYLIHLLEQSVFDAHSVDKEIIKKIANDIYEYGIKKKFYEASSYAVFWALKYKFELDIMELKEDAIDSNDCIFLLIAYQYDKKHHTKAYLKEYKDEAKRLKNNDFDRYWLFIYEVLSSSELSDNFRIMKQKGLTFIKNDFL